MKVTRKKNDKKMVVEAWSSVVKVYDISSGKLVKTLHFTDHVQAVIAVKSV